MFKVKFGVRSVDGRASNVWTCLTQPAKGDLYLTSDILGQALKLSDHPSGRAHIAYHREKRDALFTTETLPKARFILEREADIAQAPFRQVASLFVPWGSPHGVSLEGPSDIVWLPEAPEGKATEIGLFRYNVASSPSTWPGMREGAKLVARMPLAEANCAFVVWRHTDFEMPKAPANRGSRGFFKGRTEADLLEANRAVLFGTNDAGAFMLTEVKVSVQRNS